MIPRDYNNLEYKKARALVRKRDGYKCKICHSKKKCQVHHVKPFSLFPALLSDPKNMLTLCKTCHQRMWSKEEDFASYCLLLINGNSNIYDVYSKYEEENGK